MILAYLVGISVLFAWQTCVANFRGVLANTQGDSSNLTDTHPEWLLRTPSKPSPPGNTMTSGGATSISMYRREVAAMRVKTMGTDGEVIDALHHYFFNQFNGTAMELGAMDGVRHTETKRLVRFGWQRILVEADPINSAKLAKLDVYAIHAAICSVGSEAARTLHYSRLGGATNGIFEYMDETHLRQFHPSIYHAVSSSGNISGINWASISPDYYTNVTCLSLDHVLGTIQITHINLFILDVEGAELEVLKSIDYKRVVFDVIIVETEASN